MKAEMRKEKFLSRDIKFLMFQKTGRIKLFGYLETKGIRVTCIFRCT